MLFHFIIPTIILSERGYNRLPNYNAMYCVNPASLTVTYSFCTVSISRIALRCNEKQTILI